ncbi:hypothetical protein AVEN_214743-1 [Araneus ventricosus]|uniref:Uncharacterized protein n=1 Tax=Araneus ventricosus TaxID=182803 RepID=A0A4Y2IFH3_ARAVE|nr:hypothetical protein AVEN_214743-1 [Araneus ventricosus]
MICQDASSFASETSSLALIGGRGVPLHRREREFPALIERTRAFVPVRFAPIPRRVSDCEFRYLIEIASSYCTRFEDAKSSYQRTRKLFLLSENESSLHHFEPIHD